MEFSWWLYWEAAEAGGYWEHLQAGGREEAERAARATLLAGDWGPGNSASPGNARGGE